jgi:hypothetical protein
MSNVQRVLVKLRSSNALRTAGSRVNLRPLYSASPAAAFGLDAAPNWYVGEFALDAASPWDMAHSQVAAQLGVAEADCLFAEPDIEQSIYVDSNGRGDKGLFAVGAKCNSVPKDGGSGKALGPNEFAWHLGDRFSGLKKASEAVEFKNPRTRIISIPVTTALTFRFRNTSSTRSNGTSSRVIKIPPALRIRTTRFSCSTIPVMVPGRSEFSQEEGSRIRATYFWAALPARKYCRCALQTAWRCFEPAPWPKRYVMPRPSIATSSP